MELLPDWRILPESHGLMPEQLEARPYPIMMSEGPGWGSGSHESTQLCLSAIGYLIRIGFRAELALDFGSGSGILSIAATRAGCRVEAVEIDVASNEHALQNSKLNGVQSAIDIHTHLSSTALPCDLVLANILRPVLLDYAPALCSRQKRSGYMVLSGLLSTDVPSILARYSPLLGSMRPTIYERGEWRAVMFAPA